MESMKTKRKKIDLSDHDNLLILDVTDRLKQFYLC